MKQLRSHEREVAVEPHPKPELEVSQADFNLPRRKTLAFRALILADLAPGLESGPIHVDKNDFAAVLEQLSPKLELRVPERLGGGARELSCSLRFTGLKDFQADTVAAAVPVVSDLLGLRRRIDACLRGETELSSLCEALPGAFRDSDLAERLRVALAAPSPARPSVPTSAASKSVPVSATLDSLLAKVDLPESAGGVPSARSLVEALTAALLPAVGVPTPSREGLRPLLADIDARLTRQVAAIVESQPFTALEEAWRGLKFVVDRTDFRSPVQLEVLPVAKDDFLDAYFEKVFKPEYDDVSQVPLAMVFAAYSFDRSGGDLEALQHAARMGESLRTPFVLGGSPEYWGVRQAALLASMPDPITKTRSAEYAKWNHFRKDELSLWLALTINRFLLREAWGSELAPVKGWAWTPAGSAVGGSPLWGSGVWALAAAVLQGFAAEGVRFPMAGANPPALLEGLPVRLYRPGKAEPVSFPLEVLLSDQRAFELTECGFATLVAKAGSDSACFLTAPTFHAAARYDDEEATRASFRAATLPCQAFAGFAAHVIQKIARDVGGGLDPKEVEERFRGGILAFLASCEPTPVREEVEIELAPSREAPHMLDVTVRLRPQFTIYGGAVDLVVGCSIPA